MPIIIRHIRKMVRNDAYLKARLILVIGYLKMLVLLLQGIKAVLNLPVNGQIRWPLEMEEVLLLLFLLSDKFINSLNSHVQVHAQVFADVLFELVADHLLYNLVVYFGVENFEVVRDEVDC